MFTAGDEFGRTQGGNNNAYAQDNATTWLDWVAADESLIGFVARLIALRAKHPALRDDRFLTGTALIEGEPPDALWLTRDGQPMVAQDWQSAQAGIIGLVLFVPGAPGPQGDRAVVWFNRTYSGVQAAMPAARSGRHWRLEFASSGEGTWPADEGISLAARSVTVCCEA